MSKIPSSPTHRAKGLSATTSDLPVSYIAHEGWLTVSDSQCVGIRRAVTIATAR